jgi:glycerol-3-phosphate dehydrogenase (NAD(P)+)
MEAMTAAEQTVEGVPAARLAAGLIEQRDPSAWDSLPLMSAILGVIDEHADPVESVVSAVLPARR